MAELDDPPTSSIGVRGGNPWTPARALVLLGEDPHGRSSSTRSTISSPHAATKSAGDLGLRRRRACRHVHPEGRLRLQATAVRETRTAASNSARYSVTQGSSLVGSSGTRCGRTTVTATAASGEDEPG